jgi:hypothetical protein
MEVQLSHSEFWSEVQLAHSWCELQMSHFFIMLPGIVSVKVHSCQDQLSQASAVHLAEDGHFEMHSDLEIKLSTTRIVSDLRKYVCK